MSIGLRGIHADLRGPAEYTLAIARFNGINPIITSVFRSWAEQARLRRRWEAGKSQFPANRPGDSAHNYGLAFDAVVPADQLATWTAIRQWVGWGVPSNDVIHAELPAWRSALR